MSKRNTVFLILTFYCFISCGTNYYYTEKGSLRPKRNNFKTEKLITANYQLIDTSAIYLADKDWFFKFYGDNKCGFFNLKKETLSYEILDPDNAKMGYFEIKNNEIITYLFVNGGNKFYYKQKFILDKNQIIGEREKYVRKSIPIGLLRWKPNW